MSSDEFEQRLIDLHRGGHTVPGIRGALAEWFKRDTWTRDEGLQLLLGLSPGTFYRASMFRGCSSVDGATERIFSARYLDGSLVCLLGYRNACTWMASESDTVEELPLTSFELLHLGSALRRYEDIWDSGQHPPRCTPTFFVEWAIAKEIEIPWLEWAIADGLVASRTGVSVVEQIASRAVRRAAEVQPAAAVSSRKAVIVHRVSRRRSGDALSPLIALAMGAAAGKNWQSGWSELVAMAERESRPAPLLGSDSGGVKYADERKDPDGVAWLTREQFRNRVRSTK